MGVLSAPPRVKLSPARLGDTDVLQPGGVLGDQPKKAASEFALPSAEDVAENEPYPAASVGAVEFVGVGGSMRGDNGRLTVDSETAEKVVELSKEGPEGLLSPPTPISDEGVGDASRQASTAAASPRTSDDTLGSSVEVESPPLGRSSLETGVGSASENGDLAPDPARLELYEKPHGGAGEEGRAKLWACLPEDVVAAVVGAVDVSELQVGG